MTFSNIFDRIGRVRLSRQWHLLYKSSFVPSVTSSLQEFVCPVSGVLFTRVRLSRLWRLVLYKSSFVSSLTSCSLQEFVSCEIYAYLIVPLSVSLSNHLSDPVFDGVGLASFKSTANAFLLAWSALSFLSPTVLSFSSFHGLVVWCWGLWTERVSLLSPGLAQRTPK